MKIVFYIVGFIGLSFFISPVLAGVVSVGTLVADIVISHNPAEA